MAHLNSIFVDKITGQVSVMQPAPKARQGVESTDNFMLRINGKVLKDKNKQHVEDYQIKPGAVPMREHRNAWVLDVSTGKVKVDMNMAYALRKQALFQRWQQAKRLVDETLEFAMSFGDQVAIAFLEKEQTRVAAIPATIKTELDRFLADGDEGALGHYSPDWPNLTSTGLVANE